jgi:hypothetical protein
MILFQKLHSILQRAFGRKIQRAFIAMTAYSRSVAVKKIQG